MLLCWCDSGFAALDSQMRDSYRNTLLCFLHSRNLFPLGPLSAAFKPACCNLVTLYIATVDNASANRNGSQLTTVFLHPKNYIRGRDSAAHHVEKAPGRLPTKMVCSGRFAADSAAIMVPPAAHAADVSNSWQHTRVMSHPTEGYKIMQDLLHILRLHLRRYTN